jgi:phage shock protein E
MKVKTILKCISLIAAGACLMLACSKPSASSQQVNAASAAPDSSNNAVRPTATIASQPQAPEDKIIRIKADEAKKLVEEGKAVVIDVRGSDAFKNAHIKGSLDFPIGKLESGDFKGLPKDKRIIAYCTCGAEQTSARAAQLLDKAGYKEASALLGGMHAWESAGGELVKLEAEKTVKH